MTSYRHLTGYTYVDHMGQLQVRREVLDLGLLPETEEHIAMVEGFINDRHRGIKCTVIALSLIHVERPARKPKKIVYPGPQNLLNTR